MSNKPFDHNYFIGYVNQIFPDFVKIHFPSSVLLNKFIFSGEEFNAGLVGNYVTIEGENSGFLGKILEIALPEKERLELNEKAFKNKEFHPIGKIEILLCFDYFQSNKINKGISAYPNIGSKVFVCPSEFIQTHFKRFGVKESEKESSPIFDFGTLVSNNKTQIEVSQQALFGRHCAIVGTTGGGKSWTVSKCLEEIIKNKGKAILIDATGEYDVFDHQQAAAVQRIKFDEGENHINYSKLRITDLMALFRPSEQIQLPKLLDAIKSLKLINALSKKGNLIGNDAEVFSWKKKVSDISFLEKALKKRDNLLKAIRENADVDDIFSDFSIKSLAYQIREECIYSHDNRTYKSGNEPDPDTALFGKLSDRDLGNCQSLIARILTITGERTFRTIFNFNEDKDEDKEFSKCLETFLGSEKNILRIDLQSVPFEYNIREILVNALGRFLLEKARRKDFLTKPIIIFVDEAHQFLNKRIRGEFSFEVDLNSFDQIAKECRKYGLFLCLATQMPRDIPTGTLSQMGTFIVHRLINPFDKEAVESACSTANKNALSFLPVLGEGEAILMGVDFPMPVVLKVKKPTIEPNSKTPLFKKG